VTRGKVVVPYSQHVPAETTALDPESNDRASEIAEILAAGLTRLEARKSSQKPAEFEESSLHFSPDQSGGVPPYSPEASHD
jgi:hypothetical protein